jgi:glycogen synthase
MKIVMVSREFPPDTHVGGIATYTAIAANLLATRGHEVHVLCNGVKTEILRQGNLHVHRIAMAPHPLPQGRIFYRLRDFVRRRLPIYLDALTWAKTVAHYAARAPEISHADAWEWPETNGEGAYLSARLGALAGLSAATRICRIHTSWMPGTEHHPLERFLLLRLQRRACALATHTVSPSRAMAEGYARQVLRLPTKVTVSPNPMRFWRQPIDFQTKAIHHLLFIGRIEYRKGIDVLLDALDKLDLSTENLPCRLQVRAIGAWHEPYIAEDVKAQGRLREALAKPHPLIELDYQGSCPHADLPRHLDWAGLLVMPTRMDNYPYVLMEALSRGCCVLASQVGGLHEICGNQPFALWTEAGNAEDLALKMREWLGKSENWQGLSQEAAAYALRQFGEDAGYRRLMDLYAGERKQNLEAGSVSSHQAPA